MNKPSAPIGVANCVVIMGGNAAPSRYGGADKSNNMLDLQQLPGDGTEGNGCSPLGLSDQGWWRLAMTAMYDSGFVSDMDSGTWSF